MGAAEIIRSATSKPSFAAMLLLFGGVNPSLANNPTHEKQNAREDGPMIEIRVGTRAFIGPMEYLHPAVGGISLSWPPKTDTPSTPTPYSTSKLRNITVRFISIDNEFEKHPPTYVPEVPEKSKVVSKRQVSPAMQIWTLQYDSLVVRTRAYIFKDEAGNRLPPLTCLDTESPDTVCSAGFEWWPRIFLTVRFTQRDALDWARIHKEVIRVLAMIKEIK